MLLDNLPEKLVAEVVLKTNKEKARRIPVHAVHRWWSRRFSIIYRLILSAYLFDEEEKVLKAIENPKLMREKALGKTFFEPFAGGGTGLVEAALAGFNVYGLDVNPVAVVAAKAGLLIVTQGIPENFRRICEKVLNEAWKMVSKLWEFDSKLVTYIFVSREYIPSWLSTKKEAGKRIRVVLCPYCFRIFKTTLASVPKAVCPFCGNEFEITSKPIARLPSGAPEVATGWKAFAVELRFKTDRGWSREYLSVVESKKLATWLEKVSSNALMLVKNSLSTFEEFDDVFEISKLRRANMRRVFDIFAPHQLASFLAYSEAVRNFAKNEEEKLLFITAASEATKCCSLLAKWYPPLGECVPAGAVKALWVPKYTAITNPLASDSIRPLARGTLASALRAQLRASSYVKRIGEISRVSSEVLLGDALEATYPQSADLIVLDPPYGKVKSYASLSLPHFYYLKTFGELLDFKFAPTLHYIESREISPGKADFQEKWERIVSRISQIMHDKSRSVLMFNAMTVKTWINILKPFKTNNIYPIAIYWVLGEAPSGITASRLKGMYLIVFRKGEEPGRVHIVWKSPIAIAANIVRLDVNLEEKAHQSLLEALRESSDGCKAFKR